MSPWCPKCRSEYRAGFAKCSDCGSALTAELPAEPQAEFPRLTTKYLRAYLSRQQALFAQSVLQGSGIESRLTADDFGSLRPDITIAGGGVKLFVAEEDYERALELLSEMDAPDGTLEPAVPADEEPALPRDMRLWKVVAWILVAPVIAGIAFLFLVGVLRALLSIFG